MKNLTLTMLLIAATGTYVSAQSIYEAKSAEEKQMDHKDSMVIAEMITPAVNDAGQTGQAPDWEGLRASVTVKYDDKIADRTVTKARIYFYYGKDWSMFCTAIVHYTEKYENKENLKLMDKNAKFIMKYSQDPAEWKAAEGWIRHAVEKDPSNAAYKETYEGLTAKIKG